MSDGHTDAQRMSDEANKADFLPLQNNRAMQAAMDERDERANQLWRIKATLQYYKRWDEHDGTARDLDSVACRAIDHMAADIERLQKVVELFKAACEESPPVNCSCHISPLCNDCIQHAIARQAWAAARAL